MIAVSVKSDDRTDDHHYNKNSADQTESKDSTIKPNLGGFYE